MYTFTKRIIRPETTLLIKIIHRGHIRSTLIQDFRKQKLAEKENEMGRAQAQLYIQLMLLMMQRSSGEACCLPDKSLKALLLRSSINISHMVAEDEGGSLVLIFRSPPEEGATPSESSMDAPPIEKAADPPEPKGKVLKQTKLNSNCESEAGS